MKMLTESDFHMSHLLGVEAVKASVAAAATAAWVGSGTWAPPMSAGAEGEAAPGPIPCRSAAKPWAGEAAAAATIEALPDRWASK